MSKKALIIQPFNTKYFAVLACLIVLITATPTNQELPTDLQIQQVTSDISKMLSDKLDGFRQDEEEQQQQMIKQVVNFILKATTVYTSVIDYDFALGNKFLEGGKATVFAPNVMKCSAKLQVMANAYNQTFIYYQNPAVPGDVSAYIFNFTQLVSGVTADAEAECYTTGWSLYQYILMRKTQFPTFVDFLSAFLQNLVGNILTFNTLYQNILNAQKANKTEDVYFYLGRLCYLILYFDPIEADLVLSQKYQVILSSIFNSVQMLENSQEQGGLSDQQDYYEYIKLGTYSNVKATYSVSNIIYGALVDFPTSFLSSSIGASSPNSSVCIGNLSVFNSSAFYLYQQAELELYQYMGNTIKSMMQTAYPISFACYQTLFEFYQVVLDYMSTVTDINKLFYNLVHNLGNIYDDTVALIAIFRSPLFWYSRTEWSNIGYYSGDIVHQIGYKPDDYDPYTPPN